ncbi:MAG: nitroreductase family protein [Aerococcaceae bacterium]|nr:nitroreductase family protein [Aerococcaceae bacterium]
MHNTLLERRSIRFFDNQPVETDKINTYLEVMNRTATSNSLQSCSAIRVTDPDKKAAIAKVCNQPYVATAPELWIFVVDMYRNARIAQQKGYDGEQYRSMDYFFQGAADAYLATQRVETAVQVDGLGAVFLGAILNDSSAMIDILALPELTFPLVGLAFGYPADAPQQKPRIPVAFKMNENTYQVHDDYLTLLAEYDSEMTHYYDTRLANQRTDAFTTQVVAKLESSRPSRAEILKIIRQQGFDTSRT